MADHKITDFVDQSAIDGLKRLKDEMLSAKDTYIQTATELAKGLKVSVDGLDQLEKLTTQVSDLQRKAADATQKHSAALEEQGKIVANTTNTISRQLMEQEKTNKSTRESYTDTDKFKALLEKVNGTYEGRVKRLVEVEKELEAAKAREKSLNEELRKGLIDQEHYTEIMTELRIETRSLAQEKADLTNHLKNEEREMSSVEGSYRNLSQRLELMKRAYKDLTEEEKSSPLGREMEDAIQSLDAHLKDTAADMGEFQRNVGNYAIAGRDGVVTTESLNAVLNSQAITIKDVADQNKILSEARGMLDTSDANYTATVEAINAKLVENRQRLADVSDIMNVHASTVAEAEEQNQRLTEALKNVDLTSEDAQSTIESLNAKIAENNAIIQENSAGSQSIKKDLKELVLEVATLSIQYQSLTEEEQNSAEGQALADHIRDLTERAGVLKDAIADTNQAITNAASDTRGFDQLGGTIQLAIDGFGLATGAAEMLGISTEDLATIQTKLQAAIAASNAMQSIQNTLQAQSAVMQGVNLAQTKLRTVAENLHTAAQGKGTIATAALTAAQWAFNAAASANPIGLLVTAIVAAVAAVWGLVKAFEAFLGPSEQTVQNYEKQKEALNSMCDAHDRQMEQMKAKGATEAELLNQSLTNKQQEAEAAAALCEQAKEIYGEDSDEYREAVEAKRKADEEFEQSKEDSLNYLNKIIHEAEEEEKKQRLGTYEYKRQLIQAELQQQKAIALKLLEQEKITRQVYENLCASLDKAAQLKIDGINADESKANAPKKVGGGGGHRRLGSSGGGGGSRGGGIKNSVDDLKKQVEAGEDALLQIIDDGLERQEAAETQSFNRRRRELETAITKSQKVLESGLAKKNITLIEALTMDEETQKKSLTKAQLKEISMYVALYNQLRGLRAEHNRKLEDIRQSHIERQQKAYDEMIESRLSVVEKGSDEELALKLKQLTVQKDQELTAIWKLERDKTIITEEAHEMRQNLCVKYSKLQQEIVEEHALAQNEKLMETFGKEQIIRDHAHTAALNALKRRYAQELDAASGNAAKMAAIKAKYEEESARLSEHYAVTSAYFAVGQFKTLLENEQLSAEERAKIEAQLAEAEVNLETAMADAKIAEIERVAEADAAAKERMKQNLQEWMQKTQEACSAITGLVSAVYDARIEKIEEAQTANTEAGESEIQRITELVEKDVITQEEGEARKRAANALTQQKDEELERKKAQIKQKQAMWDKANSLAQAGIATALAITQALPNLVLAAVAGAMGAIQIATILATPIPKYAKGTKDHPGGLAIVGDGGRQEVVSYGGNMFLTPDTPTLIDMPKGAEVFPDADKLITANIDLAGAMKQIGDSPQVIVNNDYSDLKREVMNLGHLIRKQTKAQITASNRANFEQFKAKYGL